MKVRIIGCSQDSYWYVGRIGEIMDVRATAESEDCWCALSDGLWIRKTDCEIISEPLSGKQLYETTPKLEQIQVTTKKPLEINRLVNGHWEYIERTLKNANVPDELIKIASYHYKTAFQHGFKHGIEHILENQK